MMGKDYDLTVDGEDDDDGEGDREKYLIFFQCSGLKPGLISLCIISSR